MYIYGFEIVGFKMNTEKVIEIVRELNSLSREMLQGPLTTEKWARIRELEEIMTPISHVGVLLGRIDELEAKLLSFYRMASTGVWIETDEYSDLVTKMKWQEDMLTKMYNVLKSTSFHSDLQCIKDYEKGPSEI